MTCNEDTAKKSIYMEGLSGVKRWEEEKVSAAGRGKKNCLTMEGV